MEKNKKCTEIDENVLDAVAGGITAPESKYDLGDKVRYLDFQGKEVVGIICEASYFTQLSDWKYLIKDMNGNIVAEIPERSILGLA